ncbi:anhydro-N-acetylmuramic acid kinase [Stappia sp. 22II-S9-Z10]|nr:anhydro-N-acetylmuramic acid kinase [Stappia sp. 22II-S9-Z10]
MGDPVTPKITDGKALRALAEQRPLKVLGVMSGTSMDGVDVKRVTTDGEAIAVPGGAAAGIIADADRAVIRAAEADGRAAATGATRTAALRAAESVVDRLHGDAIAAWFAAHGEAPNGDGPNGEGGAVDLIGWHGQTIAHAPDRGMTMQLGDPQALADRFGVPVVSDFRSADVAAGGEGAPLVPVYHRALARRHGLAEPLVMLNLGGVANITYIDGDTLIACDTGPANALIDDAMTEVGERFDAGGAMAAQGRVDAAALAALMDHPFFRRPPPKSLDRNAFSAAPVAGLGTADKVATLTRFTVETVALAIEALPKRPVQVLVLGGGAFNTTLVAWLEERLGLPLTPDPRFAAADIEAEAFAYMAVRTVRGLAISFPGTTRAPEPMTGGRITFPSAR